MSNSLHNLQQRIEDLRAKAQADGLPVRRADAQLYAILAECLSICEEAQETDSVRVLAEAVAQSVAGSEHDNGRGRRYLERRSDVFTVVARAVLEGVDNRNSVYRYALTLREAARRGLTSAVLEDWLLQNGGVNALYRTRPVSARRNTLSTLHLTSPVEVPREGVFTLTLRRSANGYFDVLNKEEAE